MCPYTDWPILRVGAGERIATRVSAIADGRWYALELDAMADALR